MPVPRRYYDFPGAKTNREEVLQALIKMYNGLCCYCEQWVGGAPEIEHLKPRSAFQKKTYEWNNLHLVCHSCNKKKSDRYDRKYPILNPSIQKPLIAEHLKLAMGDAPQRDPPAIELRAKTKRGDTTINHPDLNREDLCGLRMRVFWNTVKLSSEAHANPDSAAAKMTGKKLRKMLDGSEGFPSTVEFALRVVAAT